MIEGVRRGLLILVAIVVPTVFVSLLVGLGSDLPIRNAVATGFYVVGAMLMVVGVLSGARGPLRSAPQDDSTEAAEAASVFGGGFGRRRLRKATDDERREAVSGAVLFLVLGLLLVVLGVLADTQNELL